MFLDEPTTGLDPQARANLWTHVRGLRDERGSTVFLTTHYLDEADALCDRILVIDHGQIVAQGSPEELKQRVSGDAVLLSAVAAVGRRPHRRHRRAAARRGRPDRRRPRSSRSASRPGRTLLAGLLRSLDAEGIELAGVELRRPTLDDVFLTLTGRSLRDGESPAQSSEGAAA